MSYQEDKSVTQLLSLILEGNNRQQMQILDAIQLSQVQLTTVDGDPLKYHLFMKLFEANIERSAVDSASKLARLVQSCSGKARQVIACCSVMNADEGYVKAKQLLKERLGNNFTIASA